MTIKESIKTWLYGFPDFDIDSDIETDIAQEGGYALAKEPNNIVETYVDGSQLRTEYYTFVSKQSTVAEAQRKSNDQFLEELEDWIYSKKTKYEFPTLKEKCFCVDINVTSGYYLQSNENDLGVYIFTIEIQYRKEI